MSPPDPFRGVGRPVPPPGPAPAGDHEPPLAYYRNRETAAAYALEHDAPTDPVLLARLLRELRGWQVLVASEEQRGHFDGGDGDRPLF